LMAIGGLVLPVGLFWSAWTSFPHLSPWPQALAGVPIGFGIMTITLQGFNYLLDCYTVNANSALAANTLVSKLSLCYGEIIPVVFALRLTDLLSTR